MIDSLPLVLHLGHFCHHIYDFLLIDKIVRNPWLHRSVDVQTPSTSTRDFGRIAGLFLLLNGGRTHVKISDLVQLCSRWALRIGRSDILMVFPTG